MVPLLIATDSATIQEGQNCKHRHAAKYRSQVPGTVGDSVPIIFGTLSQVAGRISSASFPEFLQVYVCVN